MFAHTKSVKLTYERTIYFLFLPCVNFPWTRHARHCMDWGKSVISDLGPKITNKMFL